MAKFLTLNVTERLGLAPICNVQDGEIFASLLTPMVKALLGPIDFESRQGPDLLETIAGRFPGDEVTNLNDHRLFGGKTGYVRHPYLSTMYKTTYGAIVIKRDHVKVEVVCWFGDVRKGQAQQIYKAGLRDRRFDGTLRANDSALLEFPYEHPVYSRRLTPDLKSVELSIYGFMPGSTISEATGDTEFNSFVRQPFAFLDRPELFLSLFNRAWKTKRGPGQYANPIPDVAKLVLPGLERIARQYGYDLIEMAPSHYHVAKWAQRNGYRYAYSDQEATLTEMQDGLARIRQNGLPLTRSQQSWVCVIQNLSSASIPRELDMSADRPGTALTWPQNNIDQKTLWMYKPLSEKAKAYQFPPALSQA